MTNFEQLFEAVNREHVYIQTHNFPDPDAIASAYGLQRLLADTAKHSFPIRAHWHHYMEIILMEEGAAIVEK